MYLTLTQEKVNQRVMYTTDPGPNVMQLYYNKRIPVLDPNANTIEEEQKHRQVSTLFSSCRTITTRSTLSSRRTDSVLLPMATISSR